MKGLHFAKPLEYRVEIPGDEFVQGKAIEGTLSITNRDSTTHKGLSMGVGLAYGDFKEIKDIGASALKILQRSELAKGFALKPNEEKRVEWKIQLGSDAPIKSKEGGPFLLYGGNLDSVQARGQLDLPVVLSPPFATFISTLENHFAFEARSCKCAEGVIEARFKPPGSYPTLEELNVAFRLDDKSVHLEFLGKSRGFKRGEDGGLTAKKSKSKTSVPHNQFVLQNAMPNRALYRELIGKMLPDIAVRVEKKR